MAEGEPRKPLIIKLRMRRSEKRGPPLDAMDSGGQKRRKVDSSKPISETGYSYSAVGKRSETKCSIVKENSMTNIVQDSRSVSVLKDSGGNKMKEATEVSAVARSRTRTPCDTESKSFEVGNRGTQCSSGSRNQCALKKEEDGAECKKEKKKMDRYKKMQCWVILKRLMIGRDGWAFKEPINLKDLGILDDSESNSMVWEGIGDAKVKPIGLEDIESKLQKWCYSEPDEFAHDIRLVFSLALLYPRRSEIHKIARRVSENFELNWKSLKDKWTLEERKGSKIRKKEQKGNEETKELGFYEDYHRKHKV